jgi:hypothetical protein
MSSTKKVARLAGLLYLLVSIPGFYGLMYVPSSLIARGDPGATARHIMASKTFYRSGIVADLLSQVLFILVALVLYRLLKGVDQTLAVLMVIFLVVQIPLAFAAETKHLAVLTFLDNPGVAAAFSEAQRNALAMASLDFYDNAILADEIFMGLWLFPLGLLIWRSGFLPWILGALLFVAGFAYVVEAITWLLLPAYGHAVAKYASQMRTLELATPLWLLILGAKDQPLPD